VSRSRLSFRVIEGGKPAPRKPERSPCLGCYIVASAVVACIVAGALWVGAMARWGRL
jgi:hypothetical protein